MPAIPARMLVPAVLSVAALSLASVALLAAPANASVVTVGSSASDDYATISAAVAAATPGEEISVAAGTYTESPDVAVPLTLVGAGAGTTTIVGTLTLDAAADVSGFTLMGPAAVPSYDGADPVWLNSGAAGSSIHDNVIENGNDGVYSQGVVATAAAPTLVEHNTIEAFHGDQGNAVWISQDAYFDVENNTISDGLPMDDNSAGVNLVCGSSNVTIASNTITDVDNAVVDIANGTCAASSNVTIQGNTIATTGDSALYFGGNNLTNVTVSGNSFNGVGSGAAVVLSAGYTGNADAWIANPGVPVSGFLVTGNSVAAAPSGLIAAAGVVLGSNSGVESSHNSYCSTSTAIQNETTDGFTIASVDDTFCTTRPGAGVVVTSPPSSTPAAKPGGGAGAASGGTDATTTPIASAVDPSGSLAITGSDTAGSSSGDPSTSNKSTTTTVKPVKTAVQTTPDTVPMWLIILLVLVVLMLLFFLVFVVARRRGDA